LLERGIKRILSQSLMHFNNLITYEKTPNKYFGT